MGFSLVALFRASGLTRVAACLAPFRPRCSTASNSEEYEVESFAASQALELLHPGSTAVVPEPTSPLRSTSPPCRRRDFRPCWSPLVLKPSSLRQAATAQAGTSGSSTDTAASGSSRDPQLPWGFCCIRKTFWRLPVYDSTRYRHTRRSWKFLGVSPERTFTAVARCDRPFHDIGISKSHLTGQPSRRF